MMFVILVVVLLALDVLALKYGADSREGLDRNSQKFSILN